MRKMKKDISKEIVEKIKKEKIKPIEKWKINFKNYLYWGVVGVFILLSGAFFSLIILNFTGFGEEMFGFFHLGRFLRILIFTAPYLWILAFGICVISGVFIFQKTKTGYRHNVLFVVSIILIIVSVLGVVGHFLRMNERLEDGLPHNIDHRMMKFKKEGRLFMPEEGVLVGKIKKVKEGSILLNDPKNEKWVVLYSNKTKTAKDIELKEGVKVIIFGEKSGDHEFSAFGIKRMERPKRVIKENDDMSSRRPLKKDVDNLERK